jgi:hypothetical protein
MNPSVLSALGVVLIGVLGVAAFLRDWWSHGGQHRHHPDSEWETVPDMQKRLVEEVASRRRLADAAIDHQAS